MLFVTTFKAKPGTNPRLAAQRRMEWVSPKEIRVLGEYWLAGPDPDAVMISECEDAMAIFHAANLWEDLFEVSVYPAVTAEAGLAHIRKEFATAAAI